MTYLNGGKVRLLCVGYSIDKCLCASIPTRKCLAESPRTIPINQKMKWINKKEIEKPTRKWKMGRVR